MMLSPIHDNILFEFTETMKDGMFVDKTESGIVIDLGGDHDRTGHFCRAGTVTSVGEQVKGIKSGDTIIIQNLMWTKGFKFNDTKYWMTRPDHVLGHMR